MSIDPKMYGKLYNLIAQLNDQRDSLTAALKTALTELNETAKEVGTHLFHRALYDDASFYLTFPGLGGDAESQYAMATCTGYLNGAFRYPLPVTKKWLKLAAAQNHVLALMWLGDTQSLAKARQLSEAAVGACGDIQSMFNLYAMTEDITWLIQASESDNPRAQFKLAQAYQEHPGLIPNSIERAALIEELCQKAADRGYPPALSDRVFTQSSTASMAEKQQRLAQLAWTGDQEGLLEYGYALAGMPRYKVVKARTYGLEKDLPKAFAMLKFVMDRMPDIEPDFGLKKDIVHLSHQMNLNQFQAVPAILAELNNKVASAPRYPDPMVIVGYAKN